MGSWLPKYFFAIVSVTSTEFFIGYAIGPAKHGKIEKPKKSGIGVMGLLGKGIVVVILYIHPATVEAHGFYNPGKLRLSLPHGSHGK